MEKKSITTDRIKNANPNVGSQCLRVGNLVFISGQIAYEGGTVVGPGDPLAQCRHVFKNIKELMELAGGAMGDIASMNIFLADIRHREATRVARAEIFKEPAPTATVVGGADFAFEGLLVEISAIAVLPDRPSAPRQT